MVEEEIVVAGSKNKTPNLDEIDGNADPEDFIFSAESIINEDEEIIRYFGLSYNPD